MNKPLVSIIIPILDEERYIGTCLQSVFGQTYPGNLIEIFAIDGGSKDRTLEILQKYREEHPNLTILHNQKKVQSAAFNLGTEASTGEIVIRLDAHCTYDKEYIELCVVHHSTGEWGNVGGGIRVLPGSDRLTGRAVAIMNSSPFSMGGATFRVGGRKQVVDTVPFGSYTRKVLKIVGNVNENLARGEDNEYNTRIIQAGYKILFDPAIQATYFARDSISSLLRQMYKNGISIGILLVTKPSSVRLRHVVPLLFLLFVIAGITFSWGWYWTRMAFLFIMAVYCILDVCFGIYAARRDPGTMPLIVISTFCSHIMYGAGTLAGFFKKRYSIT